MLAFVIFALSFATVLEIMAGSMRSVARAGDDTEVALIAQSVMDMVGIEIPLQEGAYSGIEIDRYEWQLDIYPYIGGEAGADMQELAEMSGVLLYQVDLDVSWETGRRQRNVRFSTVRSLLAAR
jgi:general secretion pathway protein I